MNRVGRVGGWRRWGLGCLALLLSLIVQAGEVRDIRLWRAPDHTRLVFDLDGPVEHKVMLLTNPARVVVDIDDAQLRASTTGLPLDNTPISGIRTGVRDKHHLRVVLDLRQEVTPASFLLKAIGDKPHRLVLDLKDQGSPEPIKVVSVNEQRNLVVAVDAGHGGEDPGAIGPGRQQEKRVVLEIARRLARLINETPGFEARLVRSGDYFISLRKRREIARDMQADLFVSIHADSFHNPKARGASVFALSERGASSEFANLLAQKENSADLVGGVTLHDKDDLLAEVLLDLSQTATLDASMRVGGEVLKQMGEVAKLHSSAVETASFAVLKSPDVPSILVETGFISNPQEAKLLNSANYQEQLAQAVFSGIRSHFTQNPPLGTLLAWQKRSSAQREYVIAKGDTLSEIARRHNVSLQSLRRHNALDGNRIFVGQKLLIPAS